MDKKIQGSRILLLCTTDNMIWQFLVPHIRDLEDMGAVVDCACANTGFWFDDLKAKGLNMIEIPMSRGIFSIKNIKAYKKLVALQKENHYDFIFCQQSIGAMLARLLGKKFKLPIVYTVHGFAFAEGNGKIKNFIYRSAEKWLSKYTDVMITMNNYDYDVSKTWEADQCYKISGIGLVDRHSEHDITRQELGIKDDDIVIMSIAEFIKRKNYPTMIRTFKCLTEKYHNVKYVICGTGKLEKKMHKLRDRLGLQDKILFLGYRKDAVDILRLADIFYHQSFNEGLTMSIMEAMRAGLPVVTSARRGNADLIDIRGGFVTEPTDIESQVEALSRLIEDEDLRHIMGETNQEKVQLYSIDNVREELRKIYKRSGLI